MSALLPAVMAACALCAGGEPRPACGAREAALLNAAYGGRREEVRALLAAGVGADTRDPAGVSALSLAVARGHADIAALLLSCGADVNEPFSPSARAGHIGVTPLMSAASRGDIPMTELLLARGADASAEAGELAVYDAGATALFLAEVRGHPDVTVALKRGCSARRRLWKYLVLGCWGAAWALMGGRAGARHDAGDGPPAAGGKP